MGSESPYIPFGPQVLLNFRLYLKPAVSIEKNLTFRSWLQGWRWGLHGVVLNKPVVWSGVPDQIGQRPTEERNHVKDTMNSYRARTISTTHSCLGQKWNRSYPLPSPTWGQHWNMKFSCMGGGEESTRPGWALVSPKHDVKAVGCVSKLTRSWPRTEWRAASLRRGWAGATEDTREDGSGALREPGRGRPGELQGPRNPTAPPGTARTSVHKPRRRLFRADFGNTWAWITWPPGWQRLHDTLGIVVFKPVSSSDHTSFLNLQHRSEPTWLPANTFIRLFLGMISWPNQTLFLPPGKSVKRFGIFVLGGSGPKLFGLIIFVPAFISTASEFLWPKSVKNHWTKERDSLNIH